MTPRAALLFAAGFGTRMRPLTETRPKPLIKVAGRTLLDHALDLCTPDIVDRIVVNTHYRHDQIAAHLADRDIRISHETPDILETGGGLRQALPLLGAGPVFTLNTDAVWSGPNPLSQLLGAWQDDEMDALLLCVHRDRTLGHAGSGDFAIDATGTPQRGGPYIYTGVQIIRPTGIDAIPDRAFSLNVLWDRMAAQNRLRAALYPGQWCDVGQPASLPLAEKMCAHV